MTELATAILYGAWHEFQAKNARDAKLLAAVGVTALLGSAMAWMH